MKKKYLLLGALIFITHFLFAQSLAVNTDGSTANTSALLDVKSIQKGVLIPRMSKAERNSIVSPATGLLVFQNAPDSAGFYYYDGSKWNWMAAINGNADTLAWKRNGNAGTSPASNFVGTTDNQPLRLRINNKWAGQIDSTSRTVFLGLGAGENNNTKTGNIAIGKHALYTNNTDSLNVVIGDSAAYFAKASRNIIIGSKSAQSLLTGNSNTVIGNNAANKLTDGGNNVLIGDDVGKLAASNPYYAVVIGSQAGDTSIAYWSTVIGNLAGRKNMALGNTMIGSSAGEKNTIGVATFIGDNAGRNNTIGSNLTAVGAFAGYNNLSGNNSCFLGNGSGFNNTTGNANTFAGINSGSNNQTGSYNTAAGNFALNGITSGTNNTALGNQSLSLGNGSANTAVGAFSLSSLLGFNNYNVALGDSAARNLATGANNVILGTWAFKDHTNGYQNTAVGNFAMGERELGNYNTALGAGSLWNTNNDLNTGIGYQTGFVNVSGTNNTYLGSFANGSADNLTNSTALGANAFVNASDKIRIGSASVTVIEGQVAYTFPSDGRFKTAVTESVSGLDFIMKLRPVVYNFQTSKYDAFIRGAEKSKVETAAVDFTESEKIRHSGFIAQEVAKAAKETGYEFDGVLIPKNERETFGVAYSQFVVPLVKAVQEQQAQIEELKKQVAELSAKVNK